MLAGDYGAAVRASEYLCIYIGIDIELDPSYPACMTSVSAKTAQLQLRVSPAQKRRIKQAARAAGQDVSAWVLGRLLPEPGQAFATLVARLTEGDQPDSYVLAGLHDLLATLPAAELPLAVAAPPPAGLSPVLANLVAAMVEQACVRRHQAPPPWVAAVPALSQPYFASSLTSLRLHLLANSPLAFKRRNLFVDAVVGDRV